ncbi:MAG TPA: TonB-dependent receptor [Bacteroidales bacterium]|nr:TonB-dependent receptor [Bacteroidales bacterium]
MRNWLRYFGIVLICSISTTFVYGQLSAIKGRVTDDKLNDPVPFVNIGIKDRNIGTFSDTNGNYVLELPAGEYELIISSVGFDRLVRKIAVDGKKSYELNFQIHNISQELSTVVVSASKYAQRIQESVSSIEVLKPAIIQNSNAQSIDKALEHLPGVTIMDNEPQIRAGSGFSSGLGSRVMILVDEIPLLRGDAGRPDWTLMPVHEVDQVEVVKGASSVVYGSSALSGAINVRTAWPKEDPETKVSVFGGLYSKPERKYATPWSSDLNPVQYGLSLSHSQKFSAIDFIGNITFNNDPGYIGATPEEAIKDSTQSTTGTYNRYLKISFNTRVRSKKVDGLHYGLNGTFMYNQSGVCFFWFNADTGLYRPFPGALSNYKVTTFYADPYVKYFGKKGSNHSFKNRIFFNNTNATNNQSNRSLTLYNEYQYQKKFSSLGDLTVVAGIMNTYSYAFGRVFSGQLNADSTTSGDIDGTYVSENFAVFGQVEKKFWKRLNILAGFRYEYFQLTDQKRHKTVFRAGLNLQATKATYIRASFGQGYRFPSIGERYITTNSGGFGFYPNPGLIPEDSYNAELGLKQMFKIGTVKAIFDIAAFYEHYDNYIEFNFGIWGRSPDFNKNMGFKFFNTGPAQIYGVDASLAGQGDITKNLSFTFLLGYTYAVPQAQDTGFVYYKDKKTWLSYNTTSSDVTDDILKYRIQHVAKGDLDVTFKRLSLGVTGKYYSYIRNIDRFFIDYDRPGYFNTGITKYREENHTGTFIMDARVSVTVRSFKFAAIVNNLLNKEFSLRPATIEPPRVTTLQIIYHI